MTEKKPPYGKEIGLPRPSSIPSDMPGTEPEKDPDQIPEKKRKKEIERRTAKASQQPLKK